MGKLQYKILINLYQALVLFTLNLLSGYYFGECRMTLIDSLFLSIILLYL